jgi:short-subunit dehydrogenase
MIAARHGHVVVTTSNTAVSARDRYAAYGSSKHAVLAVAESLQLDLRAVGSPVGVTAVLPGPIRSRMADTQSRRLPEFGPAAVVADEVEAIRRFLVEQGDDPDELGDKILDAVDSGRFYLFTRPDDVAMLHTRTANITQGFLEAGVARRVV